MPMPSNPDVAWALDDIRTRLPGRQKALDYYEGRHPLNFATTKFRNTFGEMFQELADNLCDDIVDEPADRLQPTSWTGTYATEAQAWWEDNRMEARVGQVFTHGLRAGDGFVIVWEDAKGDPRPYVQDPRTMAVRYSAEDPDYVEVAAKCWRSGKGYRLNLYYGPDPMAEGDQRGRVEHYYSKGWSNQSGEKGIPQAGSFLPFSGTDAEGEPVEPVEFHDHGMPVFHFPEGDLGGYGLSVLSDVYPLQDALNKTLCDFMVALEDTSLPKRWANGIEVVKDPVTGVEESPFKDGKNLWWTRSKDSHFGQFEAAEMEGFLKAMDALTLKIARKGGLPPHSVNLWQAGSGDAPSGLSLLLSEGKTVKRCKDRKRDWGLRLREMVAYALAWRTPGSVVASDLDLEWAPIETRDEQAMLEGLVLKKALFSTVVPLIQLAMEAGYSEEDLKRWASEVETERAQAIEAEASAGTVPGRTSVPGQPTNQPAAPAGPGGAAQPVA